MLRLVGTSVSLLLGSLVVGCLKDEPPGLPDGAAGTMADDGAASNPIGDAAPAPVCPPPEAGGECPGGDGAWWGRDLDTGSCCQYASRCRVPYDMPAFETEEACLTDCRCAAVDRVVEGSVTYLETERISLECACESGDCPTDLEEAIRRECDVGFASAATRFEGCGMIGLAVDTGLTGSRLVFDAETGSLLGMSSYSDAPDMRCNTYEVIAGSAFECEEATFCRPCDVPMSSAIPACD